MKISAQKLRILATLFACALILSVVYILTSSNEGDSGTAPPGANPPAPAPDTRPPDTRPPDTRPPDTRPPDTGPPDTGKKAPPVADIPKFPWPPPEASATVSLPPEFLSKAHHLRDVEQKPSKALSACDYAETSYYAVPGGFALVTRIEQINPDGTPQPPPNRWSINSPHPAKFSLSEYITALFHANPGRFRIIVFIVTKYPFSQKTVTVSREEAMEWLPSGVNKLPSSIADEPYTPDHSCTALVYEFELPETKDRAILKNPSSLSGKAHLTASLLWGHLEH